MLRIQLYIYSSNSWKDEQLKSVVASIKSSVQDTAEEKFQTYSSVVGKGQQDKPYVTPAHIAAVVKKVVEEEDRGRDILVFGLVE